MTRARADRARAALVAPDLAMADAVATLRMYGLPHLADALATGRVSAHDALKVCAPTGAVSAVAILMISRQIAEAS